MIFLIWKKNHDSFSRYSIFVPDHPMNFNLWYHNECYSNITLLWDKQNLNPIFQIIKKSKSQTLFWLAPHVDNTFHNSNGHPRGRSSTAAISKVELSVIIVNGWKPLTIITKSSTLNVAAVLDPPLHPVSLCQ